MLHIDQLISASAQSMDFTDFVEALGRVAFLLYSRPLLARMSSKEMYPEESACVTCYQMLLNRECGTQ